MSIEQIGNNSDSNNQESITNPWLAANLGVDVPDSYDDSSSTPLSANLQSKRSEQHHSAEVDTMFRMQTVYWKLKEGLANFELPENNPNDTQNGHSESERRPTNYEIFERFLNEYVLSSQKRLSDVANSASFLSSSIGNLYFENSNPEVVAKVIDVSSQLSNQFIPRVNELYKHIEKTLPESLSQSLGRVKKDLSLAKDSLGYVGQEEWDVYPNEDESSGEKRAFNPWNNNPGVDTPEDYDEMHHSMGEHTEQELRGARDRIKDGIEEIKAIARETEDRKNTVGQLLNKAEAITEELNGLKGSYPDLTNPIDHITREIDDKIIKELETILNNPAEQSMQEFIELLEDPLNTAYNGISDVLSKPFTVYKEHNVF